MKVFLNIILIIIAVSSVVTGVLKSDSVELTSIATALACIGATLGKKKYRYILVGVALVFMMLSYFL